jgi:hypothetical protein
LVEEERMSLKAAEMTPLKLSPTSAPGFETAPQDPGITSCGKAIANARCDVNR